MKGILNIIIAIGLTLSASLALADTAKTSMDTNWVCTTNASSSSVDTEKAADQQMASTPTSAVNSFNFAAKNCRDCTKITCEIHQ